MKIATYNYYGAPEVLHIADIPKPSISKSEILVKVIAVAATSADARIRAARFPKGFSVFARLVFGITKPRKKILGSTFSGIVDEVGSNVTEFKVGDEICGMTGIKMGTYAEFIVISNTKSITHKPHNISHEEAAGVMFGGTAALYFLRDKLAIEKGNTVLINGASGAVGTNAVQLAKLFGAHITAVTSGDNITLVTSLGATDCIDYTKQDISTLKQRFTIVLDTVGTISPKLAKQLITSDGRAGLMVASLGEMLKARGPVKTGTATEKRKDIEFLLTLVSENKLRVVIDKTFTLDAIAEAHTYIDTGNKRGNCIITIN